MDETVIKINKVTKIFYLNHGRKLLLKSIFRKNNYEKFKALDNISLDILKGESVGIVGLNGSGKTTLIRVIAGITTPTSGTVSVMGKIASLTELEAGFHPDLSGKENVLLNGLIIGMTRKEINKRYSKIVSFAGLKKFIDLPLYSYSQGMKLRLAFSIIVNSNPDIFLIDENIAVGDKNFRGKCIKKILTLARGGKTIIVASHWLHFLRICCDRVIWMDKGKVKLVGESKKVLNLYKNNK
jgi:ABC-type polysaccharide/polyol phosphate transport system ATPase subunit